MHHARSCKTVNTGCGNAINVKADVQNVCSSYDKNWCNNQKDTQWCNGTTTRQDHGRVVYPDACELMHL